MRTRRSLLSLLLSLVLAGGLVPLFQASSAADTASDYEEVPANAGKVAQCGGATVFIWKAKRLMFCTGDGRVYTSAPDALRWEEDSEDEIKIALDRKTARAPSACGNLWNPAIVKRKVGRGSD
ncbi:hypothetical protein [Nocardioides bruguierae]|uniref:Uncharacterized protein n=1 Tax=Nocardioides bruguierae TaxID=2945102 RepID=A0A9X2D709_9ACTN|nr:hypothetical protein [Nocardioides bruguierae]MCM0620531.1 hypothetical protein [Nocardioides bruguierae]